MAEAVAAGADAVAPAGPRRGPAVPIPVGRYGRPEEVADLAMAVLRNAYLANQVLGLDGGIHPR